MKQTISVQPISQKQMIELKNVEEGQFSDVKAREIAPAKLTKTVSAFANTDGGDLYVGIGELGDQKVRLWNGFANQEAANGHLQIFEQLFPLGTGFQYEFLSCDDCSGLVLHLLVSKTQDVVRASDTLPYIRRGAQSLPVNDFDKLKRLQYSKGLTSFESELANTDKETVTESNVVKCFISHVIPTVDAERWLKKQALIKNERPSVAGVLLFSDEPQATLPKRCGIKVYRYRTDEAEGFRDVLAFDPRTVEGCLYDQIKEAVELTRNVAESTPKLGATALESVKYPLDTIHEIIANAVIHRDYSIADDVHIRIFDNRIEVQSPGRLPAHVTVANILDERFARNGAIVRILNKFENPPNKDVGEGLNTAVRAMNDLGLKDPVITEKENAVLVIIKHERLASPEEAILEWLKTHETIKNREARVITHVRADYQIKSIFGRMVDRNMIEQVPGTRTSNTAYRLVTVDFSKQDK